MASVLESAVRYTVNGIECILTHHYRSDDAPGNIDGMRDTWQGDPQTAFIACFPGDMSVDSITVSQVAQDGGSVPASIVTGIGEAGTRTVFGDRLPANVCMVETIRTAVSGRRNRGRNFWSGAAEPDIDAGGYILDDAVLFGSLVQEYYAALLLAFNYEGSPYPWSVWSRKAWDNGDGDIQAEEVTSYSARRLVHTLRSRRS